MKDLQEISRITGIPIFELKEALGLPLTPCAAATIGEAEEEYKKASIGSEDERAAFLRWNYLSMKEVKKVATLKEAGEAHERAPRDSPAERAAFLKRVKLCTTPEEAEDVYQDTSTSSEDEGVVFFRWIELCTTLKEIEDVFFEIPNENSDIKTAALLRWIELCTTPEEARKAHNKTSNGSEPQKKALSKWSSLSIERIKKAVTLEEALEAYHEASSKVRKVAIQKIYQLFEKEKASV